MSEAPGPRSPRPSCLSGWRRRSGITGSTRAIPLLAFRWLFQRLLEVSEATAFAGHQGSIQMAFTHTERIGAAPLHPAQVRQDILGAMAFSLLDQARHSSSAVNF
jgi:hypothetical protein